MANYSTSQCNRIRNRQCFDCGQQKDNGHLRCISCSIKMKERIASTRKDRKLKGLCPSCKTPVANDRIYCTPCSASGSLRVKRKLRESKIAVLDRLGNKCACCGETRLEFLCIDHINGDGRKDRERFNHSKYFYKYILTLDSPLKQYRLLCWNCNSSMGVYGYCPHTKINQNLTPDVFQVIES